MNNRLGTIVGALLLACVSAARADGIPPAQWTPQEQQMVQRMRDAYQQRGLPFTDDQAGIMVQSMRVKMAQLTGQAAALQAGAGMMPAIAGAAPALPQAPAQQAAAVSEEQIGAAYTAFPPKTGDLDIEGRSDGFVVNGQPYVDPEGKITSYAFDVVSGDVGYVAQTAAGDTIKLIRAGAQAQPLTVATATQSTVGWQVVTASGKVMAGSSYTVLPNGVLVSRESAAFRYEPGKGVASIAVPKGWLLAGFQHGNVGATGYVLLEKDYSGASQNGVAGLISSFKAIGSEVGLGKKQDYALMGIANGQLYPLNIEIEGKQVTAMSGCRSQNRLVNKCSQSTSFDSLYDQNGPNYSHYYWRVLWMNTPAGPIAVSMEDGARNIYITDLNSGKRVVAFSRTLGIASFNVSQAGDGTVGITARMAFENHQIKDAVAYLQQGQDARVAQAAAPADKPAVSAQ